MMVGVQLVAFLVWSVGQSTGQLVKNAETISVDIGRSVFLSPSALQFNVPQGGDNCRVEVVADPVTQRVGSLEPKVFSCFFPPNSVKYVHSGNPLLKKDRVKVQVHYLTDNDTITETVYLGVQVIDTPYVLILTNHDQLEPVSVNKLSGRSNPIDHSVLRFRYHQGTANCTVGYSRYRNVWPLIGRVMHNYRGQWREVNTFKWDCHDFMVKSLRYEHFGQPTPDVDYLPLTVEVSDPEMSRDLLVERIYLPVHIKGSFPNMPPKGNFMSSYMMEVDEFVLATIQPGILSATDSETPAQSLVFNVSKPLDIDQGYLVNLEDHARPISSFTQEEMNNNLIAYRPSNISHPQRMIYSLEFTVFDSHFVSSNPIMLDIAVRPSETNAPRVAVNKGLTLLEGQSRPIRLKNFQLVDNDNLDEVRVLIKGGVHHGRLTVHKKPAMVFTVGDLRAGALVYHHDDSNSVQDFINFHVMDGHHVVRTKFPIYILPKDDSAPFLITNIGLNLKEGETTPISDFDLHAHDDDSEDDYIIYDVITPPKHGEIIKMYRRSMGGKDVRTFYQAEVSRGFLYYRHFGGEHFSDSFEIILQDRQVPPNVSPKQTVTVIISPVSDISPQLVSGVTRSLDVLETELALISENQLLYTDAESVDDDLVYTITSFPYFVNSRSTSDAGRIVSVDKAPMLMKDPSLPIITQFRQSHIRHHKIAYIPPLAEIGTKPRTVNFVYMVEDSGGNQVRDQKFQIHVLPVNNQPPELQVRKLILKEGTFATLTLNEVNAIDPDTVAADLVFTLEVAPLHGQLRRKKVLGVGSNFTIDDLTNRRLRYFHDGSDAETDSYQLSVTDGLHRARQTVHVEVTPVDDEPPVLVDNLREWLEVTENEEVAITTKVLSATDPDTDESQVYFLLVTAPKLGQVRRSGSMTTMFTQLDLEQNRITYAHTSGEIGPNFVEDTLTFLVADKPVPTSDELPVRDVKVKVLPVDNQKPRVELGTSIIVPEGGRGAIAQEMLDVKDLDSVYEDIEFVIIRQPKWGYLENTKPNPGSEKSNRGKRIDRFKMADIVDTTVNYVQSVHEGVEPLTDNLVLYATDGINRSPRIVLSITIVPENDEIPKVNMGNLVVIEGGEIVLQGGEMLDVSDKDRPRDLLMVSVDRQPSHGNLKLLMYARTAGNRVELPIHDFEFEQLKTDLNLMYQHDGSEHFGDEFSLKFSDGKHSVIKTVLVNVTAKNDERPSLLRNAGLRVNFGDSAVISSLVLRSHDADNDRSEVYYVIVSIPKRGVIQKLRTTPRDRREIWDELGVGSNFTQKDVDMNYVRYMNTGLPGRRGTDKFKFRLTDGVHFSHHETFEIEIRHSRKGEIAIINRGLDIDEGDQKVITPSDLTALDGSNAPDHLQFTVTNPPLQGHLELTSKPGQAVNAFSQMDILGSLLVYVHQSKVDVPEDLFTFVVSNGVRGMQKTGIFVIRIRAVDRELPSLDYTSPIKALLGGAVRLTADYIKATDPDTDAKNITFTISHQPDYGVITKNGRSVERFTQSDVDEGVVIYQNTKSGGSIDQFIFTIDDGHHLGFFIDGQLQKRPVIFSILLENPETQPPRLELNKSPDLLDSVSRGKYGFVLSKRNLVAADKTSPDSQVSYVITQPPKYGYLQHNDKHGGDIIGQRLKQRDIDDGGILYILQDDVEETNDSFSFRLQDTSGHVSEKEYRFVMSWPLLEFSRSEYVVCETAGMVSVTIVRSGALQDSSFVEVTVRSSQAQEDEDYELGKGKQVQFSPGMRSATYNIIVKKDDLKEANEKIRLVLKSPVNAVLGKTRKTIVQIVDARKGHCAYTPGMIGGDPPPAVVQPASVERRNGEIIRTYHGIAGVNKKTKPVTKSRGYSGNSQGAEDGSKKKRKRKLRKNLRRKSKKKSQPKMKACTEKRLGTFHHSPDTNELFICHGLLWKKVNPTGGRRKLRRLEKSGRQRKHRAKEQVCSEGWLDKHGACYIVGEGLKTWNDAQRFCKEHHRANLPFIESKKMLRLMFKLTRHQPFWIGLNDKFQANSWSFVSGQRAAFTYWKSGYPKNTSGSQDHCVMVNDNTRWQHFACNEKKAKYICYKESV